MRNNRSGIFMFLLMITMMLFTADGYLGYLYIKNLKNQFKKIDNNKVSEVFAETTIYCVISWVMAMFTLWLWMAETGLGFWYEDYAFLYSCLLCLIPSILLLCVIFGYIEVQKYKTLKLSQIITFGLKIALFCVSLFCICNLQKIVIINLNVYWIFAIVCFLFYPLALDLQHKMQYKNIIKKINLHKYMLESTSNKINLYFDNYAYTDKAVNLFSTMNRNNLAEARDRAKRRDYNQLCKRVKKCWKKGKLKNVFKDTYIENKVVSHIINLLKTCDNTKTTKTLTKRYEKLKRSAKALRVLKLPHKVDLKNDLDMSSMINFNKIIKDEITKKDMDITLLKNKRLFGELAEKYICLKKKKILYFIILVTICILSLTCYILVSKEMVHL